MYTYSLLLALLKIDILRPKFKIRKQIAWMTQFSVQCHKALVKFETKYAKVQPKRKTERHETVQGKIKEKKTKKKN